MRSLLFFCSFILFFSSCTTNHEVDLIVYNAKVYTVDSSFHVAEAFAVRNGVFIEIGTSEHILKRYTSKEEIDAQGLPIYPGFYDGHAHFMLFAHSLEIADLSKATSFNEAIDILRQHRKAHPHQTWVVGQGWNQNNWADDYFPTKDSLDTYFPNIPVFLSRTDYHAAVVNSRALEIAGIDTAFFVEGGVILTDSVGELSGLLMDNAVNLVKRHIPELDDEDVKRIAVRAQDSLFSVGLTSIVDAGLDELELERLKNLYTSNILSIRNYAMLHDEPKVITKFLRGGIYDEGRLTVRAVKIMGDGNLYEREACLLAPYDDDIENQGFLLQKPEDFDQLIRQLAASNFQVSTHAVGDSAVRFFLDTYAKHLTEGEKRRWRIEHIHMVGEKDVAKFGKYHIIPSVHPIRAASDTAWLEKRLGAERMSKTHAYNQLKNSYGKIVLGSDFPIQNFNPLYNFHAAVVRIDHAESTDGVLQQDNALSRQDALRGMTLWAAYSCFQEKKRGSIERGKDADFVILEKDIMEAPEEELRDIRTLRTVLAGQTVFYRER